MSTFLSFPSIHHIFQVSILFRRKHIQVARYDRNVFFRVLDRSLFEKVIFSLEENLKYLSLFGFNLQF